MRPEKCFKTECEHRANYTVWTRGKRRKLCFAHAVIATRTEGRKERLWTP